MKRIFSVITLTLAMNFLAVAAGVGWLYQSGALNRDRVMAIKEILFPKPVEPAPATQPADDPTTQPTLKLDELLAKAAGRSASAQVEFIKNAFDAQQLVLDRRWRELNDLQQSVDLAKAQTARDRAALDAEKKALNSREQQATRLASDKGFQDSLALYNTMTPRQVKTVFMTLDDQTILKYLQAMQPRTAAKIVKEFKTPEETDRIQKIFKELAPIVQASAKE
jgi:hypothetical protein